MAITKANRSVYKKQSAHHGRQSVKHASTKRTTQPSSSLDRFVRFPHSKFFYFRPAKGKTVEKVEFSASVDHHDITIWFTNKTSLNFSIEAGFTLKPEYSDWKSGEQRIVRSWPLLRSS